MSEIKKSRWLEPFEAKLLGLKVKPNEAGRKNARYQLTNKQYDIIVDKRTIGNSDDIGDQFKLSAFSKDNQLLDIDEYCVTHSLPRDNVKSYKLVTHTGMPYYNIQFREQYVETEEVEKQIDFDAILSKYVSSKPPKLKKVKPSKYVDRLIYTDTHIGMTTNENGFSLYGGKWDEIEQEKRFNKIVEKVLEHKKSNIIYIDDLGDYLDGWDGETTRKGHKLPQNMDNEKAFDTGLKLKILLTDALSHHYEKVICHNICNDNHAGSFGYILNSAFKSISEHKYNNVEVINQRKFIDHYAIGKHGIILTHGKDDKALKFGFKPHLDPKQIEKISEYIRINKIHEDYIEFSKGDSHQFLLDYASSDIFDYCNYGAVSPSSEWVQTNFKQGRSSFVLQHINPKENEKIVKPFYFNWDE